MEVSSQMHKHTKIPSFLLFGIILLSITLSACQPAEPELDIDAQRTAFAQTAAAQSTQTAAAQPTPTETPEPSPTFTPTEVPTSTPILSPTPAEPDDQPPGGGTNRAQLIDQEPENNLTASPGQEFTVTWTLENRGTSTWSTSYYIEYAFGDQMSVEEKVFLWIDVPPERSLPISVNFIAPESPGNKVSNWKLFDADGIAFYDFNFIVNVDN